MKLPDMKQPPPSNNMFDQGKAAYSFPVPDMSQPPPGYMTNSTKRERSPLEEGEQADSEIEFINEDRSSV